MQRPFRPSGSPIWPWAPPKPQVWKDYQEGTAIEWEKCSLDEQEKFKRFQFLEVKRTFQAELTAEEAQEKTEIERHYSFGSSTTCSCAAQARASAASSPGGALGPFARVKGVMSPI